VSVHVEAVPHLHRTLALVRSLGAKAGAVLNPSTPASALEDVASELDFVVVMAVNPGFGGQSFIPRTLEKIRRVRGMLERADSTAPIEVDGGVDLANAAAVVEAGAGILVAGHAIFGAPDAEAATRALREAVRHL
jgi:ribulose-phosphate 3-epimerase